MWAITGWLGGGGGWGALCEPVYETPGAYLPAILKNFFSSIFCIFESNTSSNCYGRPLLQGWLFPDLYTIPNHCDGNNSI